MSETNQSNPLAPKKPTEAIPQQPYTTPNYESETHKVDEEVLRETLEEQAKAEKELEERIKKEQAQYELFTLEFGVQSDSNQINNLCFVRFILSLKKEDVQVSISPICMDTYVPYCGSPRRPSQSPTYLKEFSGAKS
nr:hypothetical protein [Tanacetum cinerariifolium]